MRCGTKIPDKNTDEVCSEDCWIQLFLGNCYDYYTGKKVEVMVREYVEKNRV